MFADYRLWRPRPPPMTYLGIPHTAYYFSAIIYCAPKISIPVAVVVAVKIGIQVAGGSRSKFACKTALV